MCGDNAGLNRRPSASHMLRLCKLGRHVSKKKQTLEEIQNPNILFPTPKYFVLLSILLRVVVHYTSYLLSIILVSSLHYILFFVVSVFGGASFVGIAIVRAILMW